MAWNPIGWKAAWFAEIDRFPCELLAFHFPDVPNLGDMTKLTERILSGEIEAPEVLCGGTPCQAFSVGGLGNSLDDARGMLTLKFCEIADAIDIVRGRSGLPPCIVFWENVDGVLSTKDNAFGCFLGKLSGNDQVIEPGSRPEVGKDSQFWRWKKPKPNTDEVGQHIPKWPCAGEVIGPQRRIAWRVLNAEFFGLAQRRNRVFVVASAGSGFDAGTILFESEGMRRHSAPRRETGESTSHPIAGSLTSSGRGIERAGETRGQDPVIAIPVE